MFLFCSKCIKKQKVKNPRVAETNKGNLILLCVVRDSKKWKFIKKQEASGLINLINY